MLNLMAVTRRRGNEKYVVHDAYIGVWERGATLKM